MKITLKEINIYEVDKLHQKILKEILIAKSAYTLNFINVEKIDLSAIQLILSLKKYCITNKIILKITNIVSEQIKDLFKLFSIDEQLGLQL